MFDRLIISALRCCAWLTLGVGVVLAAVLIWAAGYAIGSRLYRPALDFGPTVSIGIFWAVLGVLGFSLALWAGLLALAAETKKLLAATSQS